MTIPFVQTINANTPNLTGPEKVQLLEDWCYAQGYEDMIFDPDLGDFVPNPESKSDFMDRVMTQDIRHIIRNYRYQQQAQSIIAEEPNI